MMNLHTLLTSLLSGLWAAIAHAAARDRAPKPVVILPWDRVGHLLASFEALYADWRNGLLPSPAPVVPASPTLPAESPSESSRRSPDAPMTAPPAPAPSRTYRPPISPHLTTRGPAAHWPATFTTGETLTSPPSPRNFRMTGQRFIHIHFVPISYLIRSSSYSPSAAHTKPG